MAIFTRFFGRTVGEGAGVAIGTATAKVVEPALQELSNAAWEHDAHLPLDPQDAAALVARETLGSPTDPDNYYPGIDLGELQPEKEAAYSGLRRSRFQRLVALAREHPSVAELFALRRRRIALGAGHGIERAEYREWLRRQGFTTEVIDALTRLLTQFLSPADIANAVQQGFVPGDGILPPAETGDPPYTPPVEEVQLDTAGVFKTSGMSDDDLKVLAQLSGNPPGPETLIDMWRRHIITETAVERGIREGRTKTKWTPALKRLRDALLSPSVLVNLVLRGWYSEEEIAPRMALHGYSAQQLHDWYLASGRPAAPVQMQTAWARGVTGPDGRAMDETQFKKGIRESDIRPEWGEMLWGIRYAYPSLFQLRGAVQAGFIGRARALEILKFERYEDQDALALVNGWLTGSGTTAKGLTATDLADEYEGMFLTRTQYVAGLKQLGYSDESANAKADAQDAKRARQARNALIARIHTQFVGHRISYDRAVDALGRANVPARVRDLLLPDWQLERELTADALTPAQIKKAWKKAFMTRAEALDRLGWKGYETADANIYLDE